MEIPRVPGLPEIEACEKDADSDVEAASLVSHMTMHGKVDKVVELSDDEL